MKESIWIKPPVKKMKLSTTFDDSVIMKKGLSMNVIIMFKIQVF